MRSLLIGALAVTLLAGSAMAANSVTLVPRGLTDVSPDPGFQLDIAETGGAPFIMDIFLEADGAIKTSGVRFGQSSPGVQYAPFQNNAVFPTNVQNYGDSFDFPGQFDIPVNSSGWPVTTDATGVPMKQVPGGAIAALLGVGINNEVGGFAASGAASGFLAWMEITAYAEGDSIIPDGVLGDLDNNAYPDVAFLGVDIVPEPASAMLLLLGVPFLRRRR